MSIVFDKGFAPKLFLIDSIGAIISAFLLGVVLRRNVELIGMPEKTLSFLAILALLYALYSGLCYFLKVERWRVFMRIIATANLFHSCLTIVLVYINFATLTVLGISYFGLEVLIVLVLSRVELMLASTAT